MLLHILHVSPYCVHCDHTELPKQNNKKATNITVAVYTHLNAWNLLYITYVREGHSSNNIYVQLTITKTQSPTHNKDYTRDTPKKTHRTQKITQITPKKADV
jgi:hypothetical protein